MSKYTYKEIVNKAKNCKNNVKKEYKLGINAKWCYYIASAILTPKKDIPRININDAPNPTGSNISRQISKKDYLDVCKRLVEYVKKDKKHRLPNYITYKGLKIRPRLLTEVLSRILVYYDTHGKLPSEAEINSKVFTKPTEHTNKVLEYFIKKFGKVSTIDGALGKVNGKGYGYYYDDHKTNKQTIDAMANNTHSDDPNCTDSCHVFYNIAKGLGYDVHCIHVKCSGGDGHVRLKLRHKKHTDNQWIYRDPACVISDNGKSVGCNWCMDGSVLATDPSWFMSNLNR